jgi:surface carbohydrate biosynthesis protein
MKLRFLPPKQKEIALFDASGLEEARGILEKDKYEIIFCRKEEINIFVLIKSILKKNIFFKKIDYYNQYLKEINSKIIITFNDNNELFYKINKDKIHSIAVQNGSRSYHNDILKKFKLITKKYKIENYFVFNESFKKELSKFVDAEFIILGSPLNNNYKKRDYNFKNTALYMSSFSYATYSDFSKNKKKFYQFYQREIDFIKKIYFELKKKNIRLYILGKCRDKFNKSIEKKFYSLSSVDFIQNYKNRKTFDIASKFEILIGYSSSTLTYEMLARQKKIIVLNRNYNHFPFNTKHFGYFSNLPVEGFFWTKSGNINKFMKVFNLLKKLSKNEWKDILKKNKKYTCEYNFLNKKLKDHIQTILDN